jgi:hypothetical protein
MWANSNAYGKLVGKPEGKRLLGKQKRRWVDNIKMDVRENRAVLAGLIWLRMGTSRRLL